MEDGKSLLRRSQRRRSSRATSSETSSDHRSSVLKATAAPARIARNPRRLFRARFFADYFTLFAKRAHRSAPNQALLELSKRGCRMKWLLAWMILNALVFVWRVL